MTKAKLRNKGMTKVTKRRRVMPQLWDLLAWNIFDKLDGTPTEKVTPELIGEWIKEVMGTIATPDLPKLHKLLYEEYEEFHDKFLPPPPIE